VSLADNLYHLLLCTFPDMPVLTVEETLRTSSACLVFFLLAFSSHLEFCCVATLRRGDVSVVPGSWSDNICWIFNKQDDKRLSQRESILKPEDEERRKNYTIYEVLDKMI
jgi:hypothetical protein